MKQIKVKDNPIVIGEDYLYNYLVRLGVQPDLIPHFLSDNPPIEDLDNPYDLDNMERGITALHEALEQNKRIYVQADCDTDGYTSAAIFCQYVRSASPNVQLRWGIHAGKEHGIELDKIEDADFVVIPDAGSMQLDEQRQMAESGKTVLILDHHEVSATFEHPNVILINNQASSHFSNKALSGAGVTLLFVKAYDEKYGVIETWRNYLDLAAVGIIADVMDTRTAGNNWIIRYGLSHIRNKILQEILKSRAYSIADIAHPTKTDISFYVAPLINGLIRSGEQEEKEEFFKAMSNNDLLDTVTTTNRGTTRTESMYEYAVRIATNAKGRQDSAKKRGSALLNTKIKNYKLDEHQVIAVPVIQAEQDKVPSTLTGLIAMELSKQYHKPVMVLRENCSAEGTVTYSGSLRADQYFEKRDGELKPVPSLMELINNSKLGWAEGHPFAAGCGFESSHLKDFIAYADEQMKNVDFDTECIEVDYWFKDAVATGLLDSFAQGIYLYGVGIPQPKFAFSFSMDASEFSFIGKDHDTIKFSRSGVNFVMFKQPGLARQLKNMVKARITCVGKPSIDNYNRGVQVIIDSMDIAAPKEAISALDLL